MGNAANSWAVKKLRQLRQERGGNCQHPGCNSRTKLEFAHVRRTALTASGPRDRKARAVDIANHPNSYELLCHKHHTQNHHNQHSRLTKEGIAKAKTQQPHHTNKKAATTPNFMFSTPSLNADKNLKRFLKELGL